MFIRRARTATRTGIITAIAVAAAAMPLVVAGPALADASSIIYAQAAVQDVQGASVVQVGGVPTVPGGHVPATTLRFTATLPASVTGPVNARLSFDGGQLPPGDYTPWDIAPLLHATCSVSGSDFQPCAWAGPIGDPDRGLLLLHLPTTEAAGTISYEIRITTEYYAFYGSPHQVLTGAIELTDDAGTALTSGAATINFVPGTPNADERPTLHARDAAGVLWSYEGTGDATAPFRPRTRVGGGWNAYSGITSLNGTTADGRGDVVARDKDGVLWYYRGDFSSDPARPFAPRVRVGGGWNAYTALFGLGADPLAPAGGGSLLARDKAGDLWLYRATGNLAAPFEPRVKAGNGWNVYTAITTFGNGVLARDASGVLWSYSGRGTAIPNVPLAYRVRVGGGWNTYTSVTGVRDANGDLGSPDLVARDKTGKLWLYTTYRNFQVPDQRPTLVGGGWQIYTAMF